MRLEVDWTGLLTVERAFLILEEKILKGAITDYRQIHPEAFAWHGWDQVSEERLFNMILPFLRQQVSRAKTSMPEIYGKLLKHIESNEIRSMEDWFQVPVLMKDSDPVSGQAGFREAAHRDPNVLMPTDLAASAIAFGSGGSLGRSTPTFVTLTDRSRETQAWRRGHAYHGLIAGDTALYTYNTTHKGGQWMQESLLLHSCNVHLRRPEETPAEVLKNLRDYGANVLFTVQQPPEVMEKQAKAAGLNLHGLVMTSLENPEFRGILIPDSAGRKQVEFIFLGGFEIVPYALELVEEYLECTPVATLLGSSEAIPQACSTNPHLTPSAACHYNNLHLLQAPHYLEILKEEGDRWMPVSKGEQGHLVYTSWARDGTIWIRYAPGDMATLLLNEGECPCGIRARVISGVHRSSALEHSALFESGCAAG
jgi:phenylacetate-CoA ligase